MKISFKSFKWFALRPGAWAEYASKVLLALGKRIGRGKGRRTDCVQWCTERAVDVREYLDQRTGRCEQVTVNGSLRGTNITLLYNLAEFLNAEHVIETGVCQGKSSAAILTSLVKRSGRLVSTDIPLPERWVEPGELVSDELKVCWTLIRLPDSRAIPRAIKQLQTIDMCHYDSDKSYRGRMRGYRQLWSALRSGGFFISDDIENNSAFRDFCGLVGAEPIVIKKEREASQYIGVIEKK